MEKKNSKSIIEKVVATVISLIIMIIFLPALFSILNNFVIGTFLSYNVQNLISDIFEILISLIPIIIILGVFISIFVSIFKSFVSDSKPLNKNINLDNQKMENKTMKAFNKLGATPDMSYSKINELFYERIKKISENKELSLIQKEKLINELTDAFEIINEYYKNT